jgi:hypothetical protein
MASGRRKENNKKVPPDEPIVDFLDAQDECQR